MKEVVVATDSAANLPRVVVEQLGIEVIPLWIRMDDESYRDGVDIQPLDFFQRLQQQFRRLQTSQPSLGEFLEFYRRIQERARSIVSVHVAGRYSGVLQVARAAAAEMAPYPIEVVDTGTIAMAQGFVAMAAARAAAAGASLAEVVGRARSLVPKVDLIAALETLEYAVRGGRLAWAARMVGNLLNVKPMVRVQGNEVGILGQARSRAKAIRQMLDMLAQRVGDARVHIAILHTGAVEEAERLKEEILARFRCVELYIEPVTPVLGVHAGPGALGLAYYVE